mmetsp:Transcript_19762/g.39374  ORF Transcript_19762/g.39374 Transcript_19762/m.39374 type:complete len:100 (-) Transcript_19762:659-958(-)
MTNESRKNNESLEAFALRLRRDFRQLRRSGINDLSESFIANVFLNGLRNNFQHLRESRLFGTGEDDWSQLSLKKCVKKSKQIELVTKWRPVPAPLQLHR